MEEKMNRREGAKFCTLCGKEECEHEIDVNRICTQYEIKCIKCSHSFSGNYRDQYCPQCGYEIDDSID